MAKKKSGLTPEEIAAYTLLGEAGGEGPEGMAAVAHVLKNRAESGQYPSNIGAVALQHSRKGYQFTTWSPKHGNAPTKKYSKESKDFQRALAIVNAVMRGDIPDITGGSLNYFANQGPNAIIEPGWFARTALEEPRQVGNHLFAARNAVMPDAKEYSAKVAAAVSGQVAPTPMAGRPAALNTPPRSAFGPVDENDLLPMPRRVPDTPQPQVAQELINNKVKLVAVDPYTGQVVYKDGKPVQAPTVGQPAAPNPNRAIASPAQQANPVSSRPTTQRQPSPSGATAPRPQNPQQPTAATVIVRPDGSTRTIQPAGTAVLPERPPSVNKLMAQANAAAATVNPEGRPTTQRQPSVTGRTTPLGTKLTVAAPENAPRTQQQAGPTKRTVMVQKVIRVANPEYDLTEEQKTAISRELTVENARDEQRQMREAAKARAPKYIDKTVMVPITRSIAPTTQRQNYASSTPYQQAYQQAVAASRPYVQIATGKSVPVGSYQAVRNGNTYTYAVQADGSIRNVTTGRVTAPAPGPENNQPRKSAFVDDYGMVV
jgi:hypothetical protein